MAKYPMTDVGDAIAIVLAVCDRQKRLTETIPTAEANGRRLAEDIVATEPFPPFAAAVLDGFAVDAASEQPQQSSGADPVSYHVVDEHVTAGVDPISNLGQGQCAYITTGAKLPLGSNAVVGVEHTILVEGGHRVMRTTARVAVGTNVRQIGKDIPTGTLVLKRGALLKSAELGVLVTLGQATVLVAKRITVGVLSTGSELVDDPATSPSGGCIRDANRAALLPLLRSFGADTQDLGLVPDNEDAIRARVLNASAQCDVIVSSGGVSMGSADYIKPLLEALGTVHFGRLNMKPGKPTTFASINTPEGAECLVFGLPGNPVSCLVTARLLVEPALKLLSGVPKSQCMHPQVDVRLVDKAQLDPERPEYHRARIEWGAECGCFLAQSTGPQQSSRLLSLVGANALVCIPRGEGWLPAGTVLPALVIDDLLPPTSWENGFHGAPKLLSHASHALPLPPVPRLLTTLAKVRCSGCVLAVTGDGLGVSTAAAAGSELVSHLFQNAGRHGLSFQLIEFRAVVQPSSAQLCELIDTWCTELRPSVVLVLGGCSIGDAIDVPRALEKLITKSSPSLDLMLLRCAASVAPEVTATERSTSGLYRNTFVSSLPGLRRHSSHNAAVQAAVDGLLPLLPRLIQVASMPAASANELN
jgi:gephyrin